MASRAERKQLNKNWLRKLLTGQPHFIIGGEHNPYLLRWFLIPRNSFINIYLHKFKRSDDDRALHDHPWWFASLILKGQYIEHRDDGSTRHRKAGSVALRRPNTLHRVQLLQEVVTSDAGWTMQRERPTWTLIVTGPKLRNWGFECARGWVPWEYFEHNNGCGEYA
ncbi:hypothetical protein DQP57_00185 [Mycobacterium colombiense]|uniref:Uncharacterized protein n=1 Tax=Mycobacterium colombiense TaxID=339268 RepID=A0A329MCC6_9MYCO|nr:hypothetical protein [Mycobacterium colombiense]RAV17480.1 hypothetical protein DQP57_00185 [Mycobacterium colombiense]